MKIKKGDIRISIDESQVEKYLSAGWVKVVEVPPKVAHNNYLKQKRKKELMNDGINEG